MRLAGCPAGWLSWDFSVVAEGGGSLADVTVDWLADAGRFTLAGVPYTMSREGILSGDFLLRREAAVLAAATKESAFRRQFRIRGEGRELTLAAAGPLTNRFVLIEADAEVGSIAPDRWLSWHSAADLPDSLSPPFRVFLLWLAYLMWRREASGE